MGAIDTQTVARIIAGSPDACPPEDTLIPQEGVQCFNVPYACLQIACPPLCIGPGVAAPLYVCVSVVPVEAIGPCVATAFTFIIYDGTILYDGTYKYGA